MWMLLYFLLWWSNRLPLEISKAEFDLVQTVQENANLCSLIVQSPDKLQISGNLLWHSIWLLCIDSKDRRRRLWWSCSFAPDFDQLHRQTCKLVNIGNPFHPS